MARKKVKKIERVFVKDEAYNILEENIINGNLKPNTRLKISDLSKKFGISKTPVREAILRLENEGLVLSKANQWTIVAPLKKETFEDIYPLVYTLEAYCLKDGFDKVDQELIDDLKEINEDIRKANQKDQQSEIWDLDNEFHNRLISLSDNTEVRPILKNLKKKIQRLELLFYKTKDIHQVPSSYTEHKGIIKALEEKDLDEALAQLKVNWINVLDKESLKKLKESDTYKDYFV